MAIQFAADRETSEGPLDAAHNGGASDNAPPTIEDDTPPSDTNEPLDASAPSPNESPNHGPVADDEELLRQKNPLGYTVTEPTEEEIDGQA